MKVITFESLKQAFVRYIERLDIFHRHSMTGDEKMGASRETNISYRITYADLKNRISII